VNACWFDKAQLCPFLISVRDGVEWLVSRPGHLYLGERAPDTQCIGGRVGLKLRLDYLENTKTTYEG